MTLPSRLKFGVFLGPFHRSDENPTLALERDLELVQWLDQLGFDEAWIGEHHSAGWETISSPEIFIACAAERTKHIRLGTGVISLPYHNPLMVANRMVLLDHLTRGRVMMGVGPGVLTTDAYMLNIDPGDQRPRMDEALGVILRLLKGDEPVTHDAGWFTLRDARLQLRPYTQPRFPISVTAAQSSSGMVMAGKHGVGVLSMSVVREGNVVTDLNAFWGIAEETAAQHGNVVDRGEWRMVVQVHLADSRKEAIAQARVGGGLLHREYFEKTLGAGVPEDAPPSDKIIDGMVKSGAWCIGTPDDLITKIKELDEQSGGFGGLLIQSTEWGTREQIRHSYELMARYVMPHFQGSLVGLADSEQWARDTRDEFREVRMRASERARRAQAEPSR